MNIAVNEQNKWYIEYGMTIRGNVQKAVKSFSIEVVAMWFAFWHSCVRWYVKLIL